MKAEVTEIPDIIIHYLARNVDSSFVRDPNHYWVRDICKCLRQSYYEISGTLPDHDLKPSLDNLWALQSRKFLHGLTYASRWRELDIEMEFILLDIAEKIFLKGRLDMYEYKTGNIVDLKTSNAIKWQYEQKLIPRIDDIDQIQCYGSLFKSLIAVSELTLLYVDMKNMIAFKIPPIDCTDWIKTRIAHLHHALTLAKNPPTR